MWALGSDQNLGARVHTACGLPVSFGAVHVAGLEANIQSALC